MTIKVIELREKMAKLATDARAELDKINDKTESVEATEIEARFDTIMADHDKIGKDVEREERMIAAELKATESRRPVEDANAEAEQRAKTPEYKEVFEKQLRFGAASLDIEEREVLMSGKVEQRAQSVGTDSAGGFTVPEGFSGEIDKEMAVWGPMWDASIIRELNTTSGNALPWPTVDDTAKRGRLKAENAEVDDDGTDDVVFAEKVLNAYVYDTGMVKIPIELLQDSAFNMEELLTDLFGERMGRTCNDVLTTGTGSAQPNGIVTASGLGKTAASTTAFTADELIDLFHSVDPAYRASPKFRWMFNDVTLAAIRKLKDGQGNYLWSMGDVRSNEPSMLLGAPYSVNQAMVVGSAASKPIIVGDLSRYIVRKVTDFQVMTLRERYAEFFQIGMVGFKRFDGELLNNAAVKHLIQAAV
jgi:HK97 family phage major capsid protein